ncbi:MAG: DNA methyltransferase, partial [Gemmatimonadetes bacterium]|nr:DNA methyltransferase [Gemmatimonadota bacterium]
MGRVSVTKAVDPNRMRPDDRPVHDWYRFVLSYPPHLVRDYLERLGIGTSDTVLDPF